MKTTTPTSMVYNPRNSTPLNFSNENTKLKHLKISALMTQLRASYMEGNSDGIEGDNGHILVHLSTGEGGICPGISPGYS